MFSILAPDRGGSSFLQDARLALASDVAGHLVEFPLISEERLTNLP